MLKKWFLLLLASLMIFTLAACSKEEPTPPSNDDPTPSKPVTPPSQSAVVLAHSGTLQNGAITWEIYSDGKMTVKGSGAMPDFEEAEDQPWWIQGGSTWLDRNVQEEDIVLVTSLVIEDGITALGEYAFAEQLSLTEVTLPSTLSSVPVSCFKNCTKLETVSGGTSLITIEGEAFCGCEALESIELASTLTEVGWNAFSELRHNSNSDMKLEVRFHGTEAQWNAITTDFGNTALTGAEVIYVAE